MTPVIQSPKLYLLPFLGFPFALKFFTEVTHHYRVDEFEDESSFELFIDLLNLVVHR